MKKILLSLSLLSISLFSVHADVYLLTPDGKVHPFLTDKTDSIKVGCIDEEGFENVIVHTQEGTQYAYRQIDSLTFEFPEIDNQEEPEDTNFATKVYSVDSVSFKMIYVQGGTFKMGGQHQYPDQDNYDPNYTTNVAGPVHSVTLDDYAIGETEVTEALWVKIMGNSYVTPDFKKIYNWKNNRTDYPIGGIEYDLITTEFLPKLNALGLLPEGYEFALPTEAQWEFAARGGIHSKKYFYAGSDLIDFVAWYKGNSDNSIHPIKQKLPNELGLYDINGNMKEWCEDFYGWYGSEPLINPLGCEKGTNRVLRDFDYQSSLSLTGLSCRAGSATSSCPQDGFRLVIRPIGYGYVPEHNVEPKHPTFTQDPEILTTKEYTIGDATFKMVYVEGGKFLRGAQKEDSTADNYYQYARAVGPVHEVTLSDFAIGETEVTQAIWTAVMGEPYPAWNEKDGLGDNIPAYHVSYDLIMDKFLPKLNSLGLLPEGFHFTLPSEAQWEYAAKGGKETHNYLYAGSEDPTEVAWECYFHPYVVKGAQPVAKKKANELGLYDMSGNVSEWCLDWYAEYDPTDNINPQGSESGAEKTFRGGNYDGSSAGAVNVYFRTVMNPNADKEYIGFRLVIVKD